MLENIKKGMTAGEIINTFGSTYNSKRICECGHVEGVHHHHQDWSWGSWSWCTRCTECEWDVNKGCYNFKNVK